MTNAMKDVIYTSGLRRIEDCTGCGGKPNVRAELMMSGRTHYYDAETMRYHESRISELYVSPNGVYMVSIATQRGPEGKRVYRITAHDLTGRCLDYTHDDRDYTTLAQARKALDEGIAATDELELLRAALTREERNAVAKASRLLCALDLLKEEAQA